MDICNIYIHIMQIDMHIHVDVIYCNVNDNQKILNDTSLRGNLVVGQERGSSVDKGRRKD